MPRKTDFKTLTKIELAAALDVSTQTLDAWLARGMPFERRPGAGARTYAFDLAAVLRWRLDYERAQAAAATDETDIDEAKRRRAVAEARLAEMAADREAGQLLAREDVDAAVIASFVRVRAKLLSIPSKVAPLVAGADVNAAGATLRAAIHDALRELSETTPESLTAQSAE